MAGLEKPYDARHLGALEAVEWCMVRGRDGLVHWLWRAVLQRGDDVWEDSETTWCGQSFFSREPIPDPITCLSCVDRQAD